MGKKEFEPIGNEGVIIRRLGTLGNEYGATTGRRRQCNWLNLDKLIKAIEINGANIIIMNKCDIIKELNVFKLIHNNHVSSFPSWEEMKSYIDNVLNNVSCVNNVTFSFSKYSI